MRCRQNFRYGNLVMSGITKRQQVITGKDKIIKNRQRNRRDENSYGHCFNRLKNMIYMVGF